MSIPLSARTTEGMEPEKVGPKIRNALSGLSRLACVFIHH